MRRVRGVVHGPAAGLTAPQKGGRPAREATLDRAATPRPLYLVCGRRIGRVGATDRPRPWSTEKRRPRRSPKVVAPSFLREESPNSCLGPFAKSLRGARICKDGPNGKGGGSSFE